MIIRTEKRDFSRGVNHRYMCITITLQRCLIALSGGLVSLRTEEMV